jgi:hypothetical protein
MVHSRFDDVLINNPDIFSIMLNLFNIEYNIIYIYIINPYKLYQVIIFFNPDYSPVQTNIFNLSYSLFFPFILLSIYLLSIYI